MGSGPVIITDDGGPPLVGEGTKQLDVAQLVRVGRKDEPMDGLTKANGWHVIPSSDIQSVKVSQKGSQPNTVDDPDLVQVLGNMGTLLTVRVNTDGDVEVDTDSPLAPDVDAASGFVRYAEKDSYIAKVWVDGGLVLTGNGKPVRLEIDIV